MPFGRAHELRMNVAHDLDMISDDGTL